LVADFLSAQQRKSLRLGRYVAHRPTFQWYSDNVANGRIGLRVASNRSTLSAYLKERQNHGDRITLWQLALSPPDHGVGNFDFILRRTADDIPSDLTITAGKGAADCRTGLVMVWSMGGPEAAERGNLCPMPTDLTEAQAVVCGRSR
jgi:hypothetical protein